uniref:Uncharacterized protein n=1 Tax=Odontella aurita TaxID=265563 RepID=A0A7S4K9J1_9STRA|mmetsp:Transcript_7520/g.22052  ORF Transcript_7520/g.22052 Transcript_7520/m.22052 type:complete len:118 (+) Transcript_7520:55-408(+)
MIKPDLTLGPAPGLTATGNDRQTGAALGVRMSANLYNQTTALVLGENSCTVPLLHTLQDLVLVSDFGVRTQEGQPPGGRWRRRIIVQASSPSSPLPGATRDLRISGEAYGAVTKNVS